MSGKHPQYKELLKPQHQIFVDAIVEHGGIAKAYKEAYPNVSDETAMVNGSRLLSNAKIRQRIEAKRDYLNSMKDKRKALEYHETLEILYLIATGQIEIPVKRPVWDRIQKKMIIATFSAIPDANARLKAIEISNTMQGFNKPQQHQVEMLGVHLIFNEITNGTGPANRD